jgi:hypothetical protein
MRSIVLTFFISMLASGFAQHADSLQGFNLQSAINEGYEKNLLPSELKLYVQRAQRSFIENRYRPVKGNSPVQPRETKNYHSSTTSNAPCVNEDFEGYAPGPLPLSNTSWTVSTFNNTFPGSVVCPTAAIPWVASTNNSCAVIKATPVADPTLNVPSSPLGGNNVIALNQFASGSMATRIEQVFQVTPSNWFYIYAYKSAMLLSGHSCCDDPSLVFNFYDCGNNLIPSISRTLVPSTPTCNVPQAACGYSVGFPWSTKAVSGYSIIHTPKWVTEGANLSAYIGTCVRVEVIATKCAYAAHWCYCYYDAMCSDKAFISGNNGPTLGSFVSCFPTATLGAPPCFSAYNWNGPAGSGITNATSSVITTGSPGTYTLSMFTGTNVLTQTVSVTFNTVVPTVTITANPPFSCSAPVNVTLTANGTSLSGYEWSNGALTPAITFSLNASAAYSVVVTSSAGCEASATFTYPIYQPSTVQVTPSQPTACAAVPFTFFANSAGAVSYTWSTGGNANSASVIPSQFSAVTLTVTNAQGCTSSASASVAVTTSTLAFSISVSAYTICAGQKVNLTAYLPGIFNFTWNTGASNVASISETPTITTVYSASITESSGCPAVTSRTVTVKNCTGLTAPASLSGKNINVFPNPSHGEFTIQGVADEAVVVENAEGKIVLRCWLNKSNNFSYEVKDLPRGIYFVSAGGRTLKVVCD